ncbi:MAG: ribosome alternative rescue factor ArfA [Candidatus Pelagibacter sp. TMED118]|nr:MAG: ribosome alternative rescue factor ArfA [Candidatus Pelagibacter sp. TMED118]|tara:strand:+ start:256 stop:396 length:141 start_codon:yes stop_codon:yes gene_type:complete
MVTKFKKKKNFIAENLMLKNFRPQIIKPKKGKGSFKRKKNNINIKA